MKPKHIAILILAAMTSCNEPQNIENSTPKQVKVKTLTVQKASLENSRTYSATIEETGGTALSFASAGTIGKIYVSVGQTVTKGQLIAEIDPISAQNAYEAAKASKEQALDAEKRMKQLYDAGSLSEIKWIEVQTQVKQAVSMEQIAHKSLTDTKLYSPTSGYIADKMAEAGQNAAPGVPIVKIVHIDKVKTSFSVPEGEISDVKNGQQVEITVAALGNKIFNASISEKGITADPLSRSYTVKAEISNPNRELLPGMICSVTLAPTDAMETGNKVLPASAVMLTEKNTHYVWIATGGKAHRRNVTIGGTATGGVTVSVGLSPADAIIALGDFYQKGEEAAAAIEKELGFKPTLVNPRFGSGLDKELLENLKSRHSLVITLEDGIVDGGFGEKIASYYGPSDMKVINLGLEKKFYDRYNPQQLLESLGITAKKIVERVKKFV